MNDDLLGDLTYKSAIDLQWAFQRKDTSLSSKEIDKKMVDEVKRRNPRLWNELVRLYSETTYSRRHYGKGHFYTWSHHDNLGLHDPYPAAVFPKASVMCDHLFALLKRAEVTALAASISSS